jgi:hypothetical protein
MEKEEMLRSTAVLTPANEVTQFADDGVFIFGYRRLPVLSRTMRRELSLEKQADQQLIISTQSRPYLG